MSAQPSFGEGSPEPDDRTFLARLDRLSVSFAGSQSPAVNNVSLAIQAGECVALVGESGSGKSLTARALLGLLPSSASVRGQIWLGGPEPEGAYTSELSPNLAQSLVSAPPPSSVAWNIIRGAQSALVPQDALGALDPLRRIELEVGDSLRLHGRAAGAERRQRVVAALAAAGMPQPEMRLRHRSDELSGGLRQRALIAAAFIANPALIVADEPTTALDAKHRRRVLGELRRRVDAGTGALLISHDLASVRGVADRVLVMRDGRIVEEGETSRVLTMPEHPFTLELIAANPAGKPRGTRLLEPESRRDDPDSVFGSPLPSTTRAGLSKDLEPRLQQAGPRLELRDISVSFGHGAHARHVLTGATLQVNQGETVGLIGESGSGKTTLLRVALALQGTENGEVYIDGIDRGSVERRVRRQLRRRIAFVPQDPLDSFPAGTNGFGLLADALRAAGITRGLRSARVSSLADEVGLDFTELQRPAATLSGGQRQRLAIARALALGPEILLLDEPVSALDVSVQARILDLLDDIQSRHGTAYLLVSHDEDVIRHMSDRVLRLSDGRIVEV